MTCSCLILKKHWESKEGEELVVDSFRPVACLQGFYFLLQVAGQFSSLRARRKSHNWNINVRTRLEILLIPL